MQMAQKPLISCYARYLGQATPQSSNEYPEIIHEPLRKIYSPCSVKRHDLLSKTTVLVTLRIYNSGIVIEKPKDGKVENNWYPIQNFYCSAALKPEKGDKKDPIIFRGIKEKTKSLGHPLFAMVVRQPGSDGRRVLMCHAFLVDNAARAQQLVDSTVYAFKNKAGWSDAVADKEFLNAKLSYTLQQLKEDKDSNLEELKIKTDERDKQLAQKPSIKVSHTKPPARGTAHARSLIVRSAPSTPRSSRSLMLTPAPNPHRAIMPTGRATAQQDFGVPTSVAKSYYQGFNTEVMNGDYRATKSMSEVGFPISRAASSGYVFRSRQPSPTMNGAATGFHHVTESTQRRNRASASSKGHRVLASSEPQEMTNGFSNNNNVSGSVVDWDATVETNGDTRSSASHMKKKHSKHHRPSKKTMESYLLHNGDDDVNGVHNSRSKV